jgi:hypothetical protein
VSTCCSVVCVRHAHSGKTQTEVSTCCEVLRGEGGATRAHASSKLSSAKPWHGVNVTCTCMERAALGHDTLWCGVGLVLAHSSPCSCSNLAWRVGWKSMPLESTPVYAARVCARIWFLDSAPRDLFAPVPSDQYLYDVFFLVATSWTRLSSTSWWMFVRLYREHFYLRHRHYKKLVNPWRILCDGFINQYWQTQLWR